MSVTKVIKIGLPVATATSAAIATTSLVSFSKKDKIQSEEDLDQELSDLEILDEKYEDKELFYSKDGNGKNQEILDKALAEKLSQLLKEKGDLSDAEGPASDLSKLNLDQVVQDAPPSHGQGEVHNDNKGQQETNPHSIKDDKPEGTIDKLHSNGIDDSVSSDDGRDSQQIPVLPVTKDTEPKESMSGDGEEDTLLNGDESEKDQIIENTEKIPQISTKLNDQDSLEDDRNTGDSLDQKSVDPQEVKDSEGEGKPEATDVENASSQASQQIQNDDSTQDNDAKALDDPNSEESQRSSDGKEISQGGKDDRLSESSPLGTDSTGNGKEFTRDDLEKLNELGNQLSSVAGELMTLIDS